MTIMEEIVGESGETGEGCLPILAWTVVGVAVAVMAWVVVFV